VGSGRIFFLGKIFENDLPQRTVGPVGEHFQMDRKRFDVPVILRGIQLQSLAAEHSRLPIPVKRMLQQISCRDCVVYSSKQFYAVQLLPLSCRDSIREVDRNVARVPGVPASSRATF
jgi:hypothetical protein